MTTYTIDEQNQIVAFPTAEAATAETSTPFDSFSSQKELAALAAQWPVARLLALWNTLPGAAPAKQIKEPKSHDRPDLGPRPEFGRARRA